MRARASVYAGLFCLTCSTLMLEVALTRVLSVLLWSHYTFLIISMAMLGFGAAGSCLTVARVRLGVESCARLLPWFSLGFALAIPACVMVATRMSFEPTKIFADWRNTLEFPAITLILTIPFFFAGLATGLILSLCSAQINAIYFADLLGAGTGALVVSVLLNALGAPATVGASMAVALVGGFLLAERHAHAARAACAIGLAGAFVVIPYSGRWRIPVSPSKPMHGQEDKVEDSRWSLHGRIDILESARRPLDFGTGVSPKNFDRPAAYRTFYIDGSNPSRLILYDQDRWFLPQLLSATPYALGFHSPKVLIIGSGGGLDVMVAGQYGARSVTAVEINPVTVDMVRRDYADYIGRVFDRPNVTLLAKEGRHFLTLDRQRYDVIRLTGVDTKAAAAFGGHALDHVYLYTTEAIEDIYDHLTEDGVAAISRTSDWQLLRLVAVIVEALNEKGVADPQRRLAIVRSGAWADVLLRRRALGPEDARAVSRWADSAGMEMLYDPFEQRPSPVDQFLRLGRQERERFIRSFQFNIRPVTDDSPFFFEPQRLGNALREFSRGGFANADMQNLSSGYPTLVLALALAGTASGLFILLPLVLLRSRLPAGVEVFPPLLYFSMLGLGFILAELVFIQKYMILVGGPAYAMSVTLFSVLIASGLGAYAAKRVNVTSSLARWSVTALSVAALSASLVFMRWGMPHLLSFELPGRIGLAVATISPVGFALGMPFPIGIRLLDRSAPGLIPWAWGANACLTVIGSVLCVIISISWSFTTAMAAAVACYLVAGACLNRMAKA